MGLASYAATSRATTGAYTRNDVTTTGMTLSDMARSDFPRTSEVSAASEKSVASPAAMAANVMTTAAPK